MLYFTSQQILKYHILTLLYLLYSFLEHLQIFADNSFSQPFSALHPLHLKLLINKLSAFFHPYFAAFFCLSIGIVETLIVQGFQSVTEFQKVVIHDLICGFEIAEVFIP